MKTIEETRRELFEGWFYKRSGYLPTLLPNGTYRELGDEIAWQGASGILDAVCIELPESELDESRAVAIEDCRAAIESTNLGLRVK